MMGRPAVSGFLALLLASPALAQEEVSPAQRAKDALVVQTLLRLPGIDLAAREDLQQAVGRRLDAVESPDEALALIEKLKLAALPAMQPKLAELALAKPGETVGVGAARELLRHGAAQPLLEALAGEDEPRAAAAAAVIGATTEPAALAVLAPVVLDPQAPRSVRTAAVTGLGKSRLGEQRLLEIVQAGQLAEDLQFAAANVLLVSGDEAIRTAAGEKLSLPATADAQPLPPLTELAALRGDAARGKQLFATTATCGKCHVVRGEGKEVGPNLSEIGDKLSREALYTSILDPSAAISHNFETYALILASGNVVSGLLVSETDAEVTLKDAEGIVRSYPQDEIEELAKQKVSLMPLGLQRNLTVEGLVDVVEFLTTLRKEG